MKGNNRRISTQLHPLDYISPWKQIDSGRFHEDALAKNRIYTEIILPAQQYQQNQAKYSGRLKSTAQSYMDGGSTMNIRSSQVQNKRMSHYIHVHELKHRSLNMVQLRKKYKSVSKNQTHQPQLLDDAIFIRKTSPCAQLKVAHFGEDALRKLQESKLSKTTACTKDIIVMKKTDQNTKIQQPNNCTDMSLRVTYKRLSTTALKSLKRRSHNIDLTHKLSRTLQGFIHQQNQI